MKLKDTIDKLNDDLADGEVAIAWLDGSRESLLLAQVMQLVRKGSPVMIFPEYWTAQQKRLIHCFIDGLGIRGYIMSPFKAISDGKNIATEYRTNVCSFKLQRRYDETFFDKLVTFDGRATLIPAYLWAKSFIAGSAQNVFINGDAIFPFVDWTSDDFAFAYEFMQTPDFGSDWPRLLGETETDGGNHTTRASA